MPRGLREETRLYQIHGAAWWSRSESFLRLLEAMVAPRMKWFQTIISHWTDKAVLDLGSGGGFMSEELAQRGARVTAIDPAFAALRSGSEHSLSRGLAIGYVAGVGEYLPLRDTLFDVVVCVDVLEHVSDLDKVLQQIFRVLRPGGLLLFDTVNQTPLARWVMIYLAERILRILPPRTHDADKFVSPSLLTAALEAAGFEVGDFQGFAPIALDWRCRPVFRAVPFRSLLYLGWARRRKEQG